MKYITDELRARLKFLFDKRWEEIENKKNKILMWVESDSISTSIAYNTFDIHKCNEIYSNMSGLVMSNFWFGKEYISEIHKILEIDNPVSKTVIGIRIFPGMKVPMHMDSIEDTYPRLSILVNGKDGEIFIGDNLSSIPRFVILGLHEFLIHASKIPHGAIAGKEPIDLIQLEVNHD